jgi:hypothetical protein
MELAGLRSGEVKIGGEFNLFAKSATQAAEWSDRRLDARAKTIIRHLAVELFAIGSACILTDIFRPNAPRSVHAHWRGIDARLSCSMREGEKIREKFNRWFPYGKGSIETIPRLDHGTAPHFHIQVRAL